MSFLRNTWYVAATAQDIGPAPLARTFLDEPVVLYRTQNGAVAALQQQCPHRFAPLDQGKIVGDDIQCPYHGLRFSPQGACTTAPSGDQPPIRARLKAYPVHERHQLVWIWMGDPALADPALIPDLSYLEQPGFGWYAGTLHVNANYQLLVDNLLDLSHAEFLHPLLASPDWARRTKVDIRQEHDAIIVDFLTENDAIIPLMAQMRPGIQPVGTSVWTEHWHPPGIIRLVFNYLAGAEQIVTPSGHFLTPETQASTHYIVRAGQDFAPDDAALTAAMRDGVLHIFRTEDVPIIEAQQRFLGSADLVEHNPAILQTDAPAIRARRHLAKLIRRETLPLAAE